MDAIWLLIINSVILSQVEATYTLYRIQIKDEEDLNNLLLQEGMAEGSIEVLDPLNLAIEQNWRDVLVSDYYVPYITNFDYEEITDSIEEQIKNMNSDQRKNAAFDVDDFNTYEAIMSQLDVWVNSCPINYDCNIQDLGRTEEDRPIKILTLDCKNCEKKDRPIITFYSAMHGREWLNTAVLLKIANEFITGNSPERTQILDKYDIHIIPIVNPDGYAYSWELPDVEHRFWGKNREMAPFDLNRRFVPQQDNNEYSREVVAIRNEILSYKTLFYTRRIYNFILHGYGRMVLNPPGETNKCYSYCDEYIGESARELATSFARAADRKSSGQPNWYASTVCRSKHRRLHTLIDEFLVNCKVGKFALEIAPSPHVSNPETKYHPFLAAKGNITKVFDEVWAGLYTMIKNNYGYDLNVEENEPLDANDLNSKPRISSVSSAPKIMYSSTYNAILYFLLTYITS